MGRALKSIAPILKIASSHPLKYLVIHLSVIALVLTSLWQTFDFSAQNSQPGPPGENVFTDSDLLKLLTPRRLYAEACVEGEGQGGTLSCTLTGDSATLLTVEQMYYDHLTELAKAVSSDTFWQLTGNYDYSSYYDLPNSYIKSDTYFGATLYNKEIVNHGPNSLYRYRSVVTLNIPKVEFEEVFDAKTLIERLKTFNNQILDIASTSTFEIELYFRREVKNGLVVWREFEQSLISSEGQMDSPFRFKLNHSIQLVNKFYIKELEMLLGPMGFVFSEDPENLTITSHVDGEINGRIKFSWQALGQSVNYSSEELDFCPQECWLRAAQRATIRGGKNATRDYPTSGGFYYSLFATDEARGTGYYDKSTGKYGWDSDYRIIKNSIRKWGYDLQGERVKSQYYNEIEESSGVNQPKLKYYDNQTEHRSMFKYIPSDSAYDLCQNGGGDTSGICEEIRARKSYHVRKVINKSQEQVSRSGTGESSRKVTTRSGTDEKNFRGIYDNQEEELLVTESNISEWINTRRDPYANCLMDNCEKYRFSLLHPDVFKLIHYNANEDPSDFILASPFFRDAVKHLVIINSYDNDGRDFGRYERFRRKVSGLLKELRKAGVQVIERTVENTNEWLLLMEEVPKGSLIIHLGHGDKEGTLYINVSSDMIPRPSDPPQEYLRKRRLLDAHLVQRYKWRILSEKKQSMYYVLSSCMFGSSYLPIGVRLTASLSYGYPIYDGGNIGSLFGLGTNYFHLTANEIKDILYQLYRKAEEERGERCNLEPIDRRLLPRDGQKGDSSALPQRQP